MKFLMSTATLEKVEHMREIKVRTVYCNGPGEKMAPMEQTDV